MTPRPRRSQRNAAFARAACQLEVTITTSPAPYADDVVDRVGRVLDRRPGVGVDDDLARHAGPRRGHQLGLGRVVWHSRPAREDDDVVLRAQLGRTGEPRRADRVKPGPRAVRVPEDDEDPAHRRRRSQPKNSRVATTVRTSLTAFEPRSFDSPPARSRMFTGTSSTVSPASASRISPSTSGSAARVRLGEERERHRVRGVHAAGGVAEPAAEADAHRAAQQSDAEAARRRGLVAVGGVAVARDEARADGDVALPLPHELEEAAQLRGRVLAVGVDAAAVRIAALGRGAVAGGDAGPQAAVLAEGEDVGAVGSRDGDRSVGRAVVDDEEIRFGKLLGELRQDRAEVVLLVPGGDEDERVGHAQERSRVAARQAAGRQGTHDLVLEPGEPAVQRELRRVRVVRVEGVVRLLRHLELRAEREPEALERAEPGAELILVEPVGRGSALELGERGQLAVHKPVADEAAEFRVGRGVVRVGGREEAHEARVVLGEESPQLARERAQQVSLVAGQTDAVVAVPRARHARASILLQRGPEPVSVEALDVELGLLAGPGGDDRLALLVDLEHQLRRLRLRVAEQLLEDERDVRHEVDRVVPDDHDPRACRRRGASNVSGSSTRMGASIVWVLMRPFWRAPPQLRWSSASFG